jgi:hypothetical protein
MTRALTILALLILAAPPAQAKRGQIAGWLNPPPTFSERFPEVYTWWSPKRSWVYSLTALPHLPPI